MASWRSEASHEVQEDLDALVARALNTAMPGLGAGTPLVPFAIVLGLGGVMDVATAEPRAGEELPQVLDRLRSGVTQRAAELRAVAFVSQANAAMVTPDAGAEGGSLLVAAEHREGGPGLRVQTPYRRRGWRRRRVVLDDMQVEPVDRQIW